MAWIVPTTTDVLAEFNTIERTALDTIKGTVDLEAITTAVINRARDAIRSGGGSLAATGVPDSLVGEVAAIARWRFLLAIPNKSQSLATPPREPAYKDAMDWLKAIAKGEIKVESGDADGESGATVPSIRCRHRTFSRRKQDGI